MPRLRVTYKGKSIADTLDMSVREGLEVFGVHTLISRGLQTLVDVGLGYVKIGQPSPTLSGGEAQRIKLARELSRVGTGRTIYILDEPTTGLHFADIKKLLVVFVALGRLPATPSWSSSTTSTSSPTPIGSSIWGRKVVRAADN